MNAERVECTWRTPEGKEVQVSSAGVLVHCFDDLVHQGKPHFLMVEQLDKQTQLIDGSLVNPWGIPAGRPEIADRNPFNLALRELEEETGIKPDESRLKLFLWGWSDFSSKDRVQVVYSLKVKFDELLQLGNWETFTDYVRILSNPPVSNPNEVGKLALVSHNVFLGSGSLPPYKWEALHNVKAKLEGLRIL